MNKNDSCAKLVHTNSLHGNIFLDTHPNNCEAAKRLKEAQKKAAELTEKYESQFGPINETSRDTTPANAGRFFIFSLRYKSITNV